MADERDFELLDDYLTNRLSEQDRSAFEQKLDADPDLKHEYALQKRLVQGIKDARVAELKSMLNKVPVPSGNPGNAVISKIVLGTVVSLMIAAAAYWYFRDNSTMAPEQKAQQEQPPLPKPEQPKEEIQAPVQKQESPTTRKETVEDKNQTSAGTEHSKPSLARKPDPLAAPGEKKTESKAGDKPALDVLTPGNEDVNNDNSGNPTAAQPALTPANSSLVVETDRNNRTYSFHYQFRDGKLFLYGPFEKNLYEIMEFSTDEKRTVFLYYKDRYYLLQEADSRVKPLSPVTDAALITKLKEYRSSK